MPQDARAGEPITCGDLLIDRLPAGDGEGAVVVLSLRQADRPVVVLDRALLGAIDGALDRIDALASGGERIAGLVLASAAPRSFVAGADLREIMELSDAALIAYLEAGARVFGRFASMPWTTVAAINGPTLGGGLELAMHCDVLIAAAPAPDRRAYPVGLPEAGLCICPGWGGTNLLPARFDGAAAISMTASGETMGVDRAAELGLVSELVPAEELRARAVSAARAAKGGVRPEPVAISNADRRCSAEAALASVRDELPDTASAEAVVECVETGLRDGWSRACAREREALTRLRHTEEGRAAIEAFFARSSARA